MSKILIADDSEQILELLAAILTSEGNWNVCGKAADGRQAVSLAQQVKPDLIILDVAMPVLDGLHAAVEILKTTPDVPIVLYTLHNSNQIELEGKRVGARRVLSKLEPTEVLVQAIRELLAESSTLPIPAEEINAMTTEVQNQIAAASASASEAATPTSSAETSKPAVPPTSNVAD